MMMAAKLPVGDGSDDPLHYRIASLEDSVAALQSDLTAAHQLAHDLVGWCELHLVLPFSWVSCPCLLPFHCLLLHFMI